MLQNEKEEEMARIREGEGKMLEVRITLVDLGLI